MGGGHVPTMQPATSPLEAHKAEQNTCGSDYVGESVRETVCVGVCHTFSLAFVLNTNLKMSVMDGYCTCCCSVILFKCHIFDISIVAACLTLFFICVCFS